MANALPLCRLVLRQMIFLFKDRVHYPDLVSLESDYLPSTAIQNLAFRSKFVLTASFRDEG
jgi:hypothetical protein